VIFYRIIKTALGSHALVQLFIDEDIRQYSAYLQHHRQDEQDIIRKSVLVNHQAQHTQNKEYHSQILQIGIHI
jgi:hypothetical protein